MTQAELLILTAAQMDGTLTREALALAAWEAHPDVFGIAEGKYPDTQKVYAMLSHATGPVRKGWMELQPQLAVTSAGRAAAARLLLANRSEPRSRTAAEEIWNEGNASGRMRLEHALEFFGITTSDIKTDRAREKVDAKLAELRADESPDGCWVYNLADFLVGKFGRVIVPEKPPLRQPRSPKQ